MSVYTSTQFASACASGTDWRDTSKKVLEKLDGIRTEDDGFNFGFLYISDHLADDASSIFNLFRSVTKIDNWIGSVGMGVIGCSESLVDQPAISAMIGNFENDSFFMFADGADIDDTPNLASNSDDADENNEDGERENVQSHKPDKQSLSQWLKNITPLLGIVHGNPIGDESPQEVLNVVEERTNSFLIGGLSSSRSQHLHIADDILDNALSGALFADTTPVSTVLSQGCEQIGELYTITKADDNEILELDDQKALDVLQNELKEMAAEKMGVDADSFFGEMDTMQTSDQIPQEFRSLFQGEIHIGLPLALSDQNDFFVRNISGIDVDERSFSIADPVSVGDHIFFVKRDDETVVSDLSRSLVNFRRRIQQERGCFEPKGALYISCIARGFSHIKENQKKEIELIRDVVGQIPLTGFYAGGEINNSRLYGYTGILTVFF